MKKKEKQKILDSLMGFYQVICGLIEGLSKVEDNDLRNTILAEHILQLIYYHKEFTDKHEIDVPDLSDLYAEYCKKFVDVIKGKESFIQEIVKERFDKEKKDENLDYII